MSWRYREKGPVVSPSRGSRLLKIVYCVLRVMRERSRHRTDADFGQGWEAVTEAFPGISTSQDVTVSRQPFPADTVHWSHRNTFKEQKQTLAPWV